MAKAKVLNLLKTINRRFETGEWLVDKKTIKSIRRVVLDSRKSPETPELRVIRRIYDGLMSGLDVKSRYSHEVRAVVRQNDPEWMRQNSMYGENPGKRRRRKSANPPMTFAKVAMYGVSAYLLCKYVLFKNS